MLEASVKENETGNLLLAIQRPSLHLCHQDVPGQLLLAHGPVAILLVLRHLDLITPPHLSRTKSNAQCQLYSHGTHPPLVIDSD